MKIHIDTDKKIVRIQESVKIIDFIDEIKMILPDGMWKEFTIEVDKTPSYNTLPLPTHDGYFYSSRVV